MQPKPFQDILILDRLASEFPRGARWQCMQFSASQKESLVTTILSNYCHMETKSLAISRCPHSASIIVLCSYVNAHSFLCLMSIQASAFNNLFRKSISCIINSLLTLSSCRPVSVSWMGYPTCILAGTLPFCLPPQACRFSAPHPCTMWSTMHSLPCLTDDAATKRAWDMLAVHV